MALPQYVRNVMGITTGGPTATSNVAPIPPLLTERTVSGAWRDCTYAAYMMAAYVAGNGPSVFPLGYTGNEREALERADDRPDETGATLGDADLGASRRWGHKLKGLSTSLAAALAKQGSALVVQGDTGRLARNDPLRRWDVNFSGGHAVAVVPLGDGTVWWLDPLAPSSYKGERVPVSKVLQFAYGTQYARIAKPNDWGITGGPIGGATGGPDMLNAFGDLYSHPVGEPLTQQDVQEIMTKLDAAGKFDSPGDFFGIKFSSVGPAREITQGILMQHVGEPWTPALLLSMQKDFGVGSNLAGTAFDPTGGAATAIIGVIQKLSDPRNWAFILALIGGGTLVVVGGIFVLRGASAKL